MANLPFTDWKASSVTALVWVRACVLRTHSRPYRELNRGAPECESSVFAARPSASSVTTTRRHRGDGSRAHARRSCCHLAVCCYWSPFAIKLDSPGPVFFKQARAGVGESLRHREVRAMRVGAHEERESLQHRTSIPTERLSRSKSIPRDARGRIPATLFDRRAAATWNVLKGDMSLVGPARAYGRAQALLRA